MHCSVSAGQPSVLNHLAYLDRHQRTSTGVLTYVDRLKSVVTRRCQQKETLLHNGILAGRTLYALPDMCVFYSFGKLVSNNR